MNNPVDTIELRLVRVLYTVLTQSSVSRAALQLGMTQPAVSAALRRLRELTGDPLLVRHGGAMVATPLGASLVEPAARMLRDAQRLVAAQAKFDPAQTQQTFRIAAADYLDPEFLPECVAAIRSAAPGCRVDLLPLSAAFDYREALAAGEADLVLGNWLEPPPDLHRLPLCSDDIVCLVAADHPLLRQGLTLERYLQCEHVAPTALRAHGEGVIDQYLQRQGLHRKVSVHCAFFGAIPRLVARSLLVLTTGRQFCQRYVDQGLAVRVLPCPVKFPPLTYYLLWHGRSQHDAAHRWLREQVRDTAARLLPAGRAPRAGETR
ncbi:MAG: LysR family transcriptional regulator [Thiomonas sp.]|jgi:DNA-binding transcriptional LysR family regulator